MISTPKNVLLILLSGSLFLWLKMGVMQVQAQFSAIGGISNCPRMNARMPNCDASKRFSNLDGSCNNLVAPWVGKASTPYKRYFPAAYDDGFSVPRTRGTNGSPLPNPRVISRLMSTKDQGLTEPFFTHLLPHFGQFIAHDITFSKTATDANGGSLTCNCGSNSANCLSFVMPSNDNIMKQTCMKFTRTQNSNSVFDCGLSTREQLNHLSAYIDGTQIYGIDDNRNTFLRTRQQGQLRTSQGLSPSKPFPPLSTTESCGSTQCFLAGESRTSNNLGLVGIHTLFIREHNRIALDLAQVNPSWSDELLFQETRKIVVGIVQNIVYNEWLPSVVGTSYAEGAGITSTKGDSYFQGYDRSTNPSIANEFSAAAFRFGHSLVRQRMNRFSTTGAMIPPSLNVSQTIFNSAEAFNARTGGLDSIFLGMTNEASSKFDSNVADSLQHHLFEVKNSDGTTDAMDLFATNVNRGRDHGVPPYNFIRERCGLSKANDFADLADHMSKESIEKLKAVYNNVNDIDFYVGGLLENQLPGAVVGPSFACIIVNQFRDLKTGDRFFFENGPGPTSFTMDQLREIKKITMARLICNDFEAISVQPKAFLLPNVVGNTKVSCSTLPRLDITKWKM